MKGLFKLVLITLTLVMGVMAYVSAEASTPKLVHCPGVSQIKPQFVGQSTAYYYLVGVNSDGNNFKSFCQSGSECSPNGNYYKKPYNGLPLKPNALNEDLTHYVSISQSLVCAYDAVNQHGYTVHLFLVNRGNY